MATGLDLLMDGPQQTGLDALMAPPAPAASGKPMSWAERAMKGLNDVSTAGAQLATHVLPNGVVNAVNSATKYVNDLPGIGPVTQALGIVPGTAQSLDADIKSGEQEYQNRRGPNAGVDWARMGGNVVGTAPLAAMSAPAAVASKVSPLVQALASGAGYGALSQPVTEGDFAKEKAKQIGLGAAMSGGANLALRGAASIVAPKVGDDVKTLMEAGVTPTVGQTLGGAASRMEQGATSIPVVGDMIKNAQRRTVDQFNTAAVNRSLSPIGDKLPEGVAGRGAISYAVDKLGSAYDAVLAKIGAVKPDEQFLSELASLQGLTSNLPKSSGEQFGRILDAEVLGRIDKTGHMTGEGLKAAESQLGQLAKGYGRSSDFDQRQLGTAIQEAQAALRSMLGRVKPEVADELKNINSGYANLLRVQKASGYVGAEGGAFTPAQLQGAVKALDPSKNGRQFATGGALMQDLSEAGKNVMGSKVPDSGTPYRSMLAMALLGGGAHGIAPGATSEAAIPLALLAGAGSLPYTKQGQKLASILLTKRPQGAEQLAELLRGSAPYAGAVAVPALSQ